MSPGPKFKTIPSVSGGTIDDVVIIGAGLAGLYTALKLAPRPATVIAAAPIGKGASSAWAQGGIAAAVREGDTPESHARDTIAAGAGIVDEGIARMMAGEAPACIEDLLRYGVPFDKDLEGRLAVSREAAHSARRIVHVSGDRAGQAIMAALIEAVRSTPSIRLIEGYTAYELATEGRNVIGVFAKPSKSRSKKPPLFVPARGVVLAAGGVGQLYAVTTNPKQARGQGLGMAARAGAIIADAEFVQFHPTALDVGVDPAPLATEALRGEGALLINSDGKRFMTRIHPDAELAPRDIVARAVFAEVKSGRGAFLDCRKAIGKRFRTDFPTVYASCKKAGINPVREPIPVAPAAHYHMGGILTDANGRTSLDGLWACGEVTSTGAHGANRLASNSLLEAVVFGARIAKDISGLLPALRSTYWPEPESRNPIGRKGKLPSATFRKLRNVMSKHVGVKRNGAGLAKALRKIDTLEIDAGGNPDLLNMIAAARLITAAALQRTESRGGHFRSDYPEPDAAQARRSYLTLDQSRRIKAAPMERNNEAGNIIRPRFGT